MAIPANSAPVDRRFLVWLALLTVGAFLLRQHFILVTEVEAPFRGDVRQYVAYAWNLLNHGTFSHLWPGEGTPAPDSFRSPGYPLFLWVWMRLMGPDGWYWAALQAQAVLGAVTAALAALLVRQWLSAGWALATGLVVAVWPHHVAATGALLSEVLFGFLLAGALLLTVRASRQGGVSGGAAAGVAWAAATLVNPVSMLFPVLAAGVLWREGRRKAGLVLMAIALAGPAAWGVRNLGVDQPPPGRGALNLAQGSWPIYHEAHAQRIRYDNPIARHVLAEIDREAVALSRDPPAGIALIAGRMGERPAHYLRWYLVEKPWLLWDWDIKLGAGGVYWHRVRNSPLEGQQVLRSVTRTLEFANPVIFALSAAGALALFAGWMRGRPWAPAGAALVAVFFLYVTLVHTVFQAEPRYSIPYRPIQIALLMGSAALLGQWIMRRLFTSHRPHSSVAELQEMGERRTIK